MAAASQACGAVPDGEVAVMSGFVFDSTSTAVAGLPVVAMWYEVVMRAAGAETELRGIADTTDAQGGYALCGIPRSARVALQAGTDAWGTDVLEIRFDGTAAVALNLAVGTPAPRVRVTGRVVDSAGAPMAGAMVLVAGDSMIGVRAAADGGFALQGLRMRSVQLYVRAIGMEPRLLTLAVGASEWDAGTVRLRPLLPQLDQVTVTAEAISANRLAFEERMRRGRGTFLNDSMVARMPRISARELQGRTTGLRSTAGTSPRLMMARSAHSRRPCLPTYFLDGRQYDWVYDGTEEEALLRRAKRIEIYKADEIPIEYFGSSTCGLVFVWTY